MIQWWVIPLVLFVFTAFAFVKSFCTRDFFKLALYQAATIVGFILTVIVTIVSFVGSLFS